MKLLTITELTAHIKEIMDNDPLLVNLWVKGEISNCKQAASGHLYFTIKDENCSIRAIMFRSRARSLSFQPENGMAVRARGYVTVFERDGVYQLYVEEMEPDGAGALYKAYEQLKKKLWQEGLFDQERKKKLPLLPRCIGIVTSPTGAVLRDMAGIIGRRWPEMGLVFAPVAVQGETASGEIARAIEQLNRISNIDAIIVGRGGGSIEELWAFNTEIVARSIFNSRIPVISAVGHETDFTIADFVADVRAPTPSAAAELAVPVKQEMIKFLSGLKEHLEQGTKTYLSSCHQRLNTCLERPVFRRPLQELCGNKEQQVDFACQRLVLAMERLIEQGKTKFAVHLSRLETLSPLATLARGYSICTRSDLRSIIRNADEVSRGELVQVKLYQGRLFCLVEEIVSDKC